WPPVFHALLAVWMLFFTAHKISVMLFMATLAALTAWIIYRVLEKPGQALAAGFATSFLVLPLVQDYTARVMAEMLVALLCLCATLAYARYIEIPTWQTALLFSGLGVAAILAKPNGWLLALVPPIAILFTRRFDLLRRGTFWLPLLVVLPP